MTSIDVFSKKLSASRALLVIVLTAAASLLFSASALARGSLLNAPAAPAPQKHQVKVQDSRTAERILAADPYNRDARLSAARSYLAQGVNRPGYVDDAIRHLEVLVEARGSDFEATMLLGQAYLLKGDFESSVRYYMAATYSRGAPTTAYLGLSQALIRSGDVAGSEAALAKFRSLSGIATGGSSK